MPRLILAWELGGGFGHAMPLAQLAGALLARGHEVHLVWRDLSLSGAALGKLESSPDLHLWQAPVWPTTLGGLPEPASHAEILLRAGFLDDGRLRGLVQGWRSLFTTIRPDLLLADHAPTALLASRGLEMRRALMGTGFFIPPARSPLPSFRDWEPVPAARICAAEADALASCNAVLHALKCGPLNALHELFQVDEVFLLGWTELDHLTGLREREEPRVWGALPALAAGATPAWPDAPGPRIFGYLKREHPSAAALLDVLRDGPWSCLLHVSGMSPEELSRWSGGKVRIVDTLMHLPAVLAEADLVLCHANAGTVYASLAAGVPTVMLPLQAEQLLLARRVAATGAGVFLWPHEVAVGLVPAIKAVLESSGFRLTARSLAARNGHAIYGDVLAAITSRCEALALAQ